MENSSLITLPLKSTEKLAQTVRKEQNKYCIMYDKQGSLETFLRYGEQASVVELSKLLIEVSAGKLTKEEAIEKTRAAIVRCMRYGTPAVISCSKSQPDFIRDINCEKNLPWEKILDSEWWFADNNYRMILHADEESRVAGGDNLFYMHPDFNIIFLMDYKDQETCSKFESLIPL